MGHLGFGPAEGEHVVQNVSIPLNKGHEISAGPMPEEGITGHCS